MYIDVPVKLKPHHSLVAIQAKFASVDTLEVTGKAARDARALGFTLQDIVAVVEALEFGDFVKSETAPSPPNSKVWHDTYKIPYDDLLLYLKFAGQTLIDMALTSFKEV